jgi:hypothetical protein
LLSLIGGGRITHKGAEFPNQDQIPAGQLHFKIFTNGSWLIVEFDLSLDQPTPPFPVFPVNPRQPAVEYQIEPLPPWRKLPSRTPNHAGKISDESLHNGQLQCVLGSEVFEDGAL